MPIHFLQDDFSGGVNWVDDPIRLEKNEVADARNVYLVTKNVVKQREGFTAYNSSATGAADPVTGMAMFDDWNGTFTPVIQANGKIYSGVGVPPATGAFTSILTETASADPAKMDAMWNTLIVTNSVDKPQIWSGAYGRVSGFKKTYDNGGSYIDYSSKVIDNDTSTSANLNSLDTVANQDCIIIGTRVPKVTGFRFVIGNANSNASVAAIHYWDGDSWEAVSALSDGTIASAGKTLGQTGDMTFTEATSVMGEFDGMSRYWWRLSVSAALDSTVTITACYAISNMQALPNMPNGELVRPVGVKTSSDTSVTLKDQTVYAIDGTMSTVVELDALTVTTGAVYIQGANKFWRVRLSVSRDNPNANAVTMSAKYWDGDSWASLTMTDGTSANSITLAQSGTLSFNPPTDWEKYKLGVDIDSSYQIQLLFSAALSDAVEVGEIELEEYPDALLIHDLCLFHKNRLWLGNRQDAAHFLFCSAEFLPDIWNGSDSTGIGIPSGHPVTAMARYFNELLIATHDELYLLEGYTPDTFGLLKINTGGIGCISHKSCVSVGKYIYFAHSTGFYRFDGIGVVQISGKIDPLFDSNDSTNLIPTTRLKYIEGRFNRTQGMVEWTVSRGSTQATNNLIACWDVNFECFFFQDIVAGCIATLIGANGEELYYHGGYVGKIYRDYNGTDDAGTLISSYLTTRGFQNPELPAWLLMYQGVLLLMQTQTANSLTVTYALNGNTSWTALGTFSMVYTAQSYTWQDIRVPIPGISLQLKLAFAVDDGTWELMAIKIPYTPMREFGVY